jgi:hypothetical protein
MKLRVPLVPMRKYGISCPRPEVLLEVLTRTGDFLALRFIVDTATDLTTLAVPRAEEYDIPFEPAAQQQVRVTGSVGSGTAYLGSLTVRLFGKTRQWPCCFVLHSETPEPASPGRQRPPPTLLGRAGFLDDCAMWIDGSHLTIVDRRVRWPWWRSLLKLAQAWFGGRRRGG